MYKYRLFGLDVESEVPIELASPAEFERADVRIHYGDLVDARDRFGLDAENRRFLQQGETAILHWSSVGTVAVRGGDEIVLDCPHAVDPRLISMAVSGPPLGILLHQRGQLVLHASAVLIDGGVAAFLGHKGFGKSTTAAALHESGFDLFTDDILSVHLTGTEPAAYPGFSQLKLWPSAVAALYPAGPEDEGPPSDKRIRPVDSSCRDELHAVKAVFVLDGGDLGVSPIFGTAALLEILRNSYASRFVGTAGTPADHLRRCSLLVDRVSVFRLRRAPGLASLTDIVDLVVDTVRAGGNGPR